MMQRAPTRDEREEMLREVLSSSGWQVVLTAIGEHLAPIRKSVFTNAGSGKTEIETAMEARDVRAIGKLLDGLYRRAGFGEGLPKAHRGMIE